MFPIKGFRSNFGPSEPLGNIFFDASSQYLPATVAVYSLSAISSWLRNKDCLCVRASRGDLGPLYHYLVLSPFQCLPD